MTRLVLVAATLMLGLPAGAQSISTGALVATTQKNGAGDVAIQTIGAVPGLGLGGAEAGVETAAGAEAGAEALAPLLRLPLEGGAAIAPLPREGQALAPPETGLATVEQIE